LALIGTQAFRTLIRMLEFTLDPGDIARLNRHATRSFLGSLVIGAACIVMPGWAQQMPSPAHIPPEPTIKAPDTVPMGDPADFPEVKMDFPIAQGPFQPTWRSTIIILAIPHG
jgi:hypothetical protein